ncbi:MAG: hypothetical protein MI861_12445, partial [Pirellulales bacterium]|nr:hypothetical protein [Pirellulales bacterium]
WRMPPVVIQDQDEKMKSLIYRVANRAAYVVSQKADRRNKRVLQNRGPRKNLPRLMDETWADQTRWEDESERR